MTAGTVRVYWLEAKFEFLKNLVLGLVTVACLAGAAVLYFCRP